MTASVRDNPLDSLTIVAIDWVVRLGSGTLTAEDRSKFDAWLAVDPAHEVALRQVESLLAQPLANIRDADARLPGQSDAARKALLHPGMSMQRRKLLGGAIVLAIGTGAGLTVSRAIPGGTFIADLRTTTGQRKTFALADGSELTLNARSAVDIDFSASQRIVKLHSGELIVRVAADSTRPFIVQSAESSVRALGTRFLVRQREGRTLVAVLEHSVAVHTTTQREAVLQAGQAAWFSANETAPCNTTPTTLAGWTDGVLDVRDESLGEVIAALRDYRSGFLRVSPAAAKLRVFGVFHLDDSDNVLQALAETLPISVRRYGRWYTAIDVRKTGD